MLDADGKPASGFPKFKAALTNSGRWLWDLLQRWTIGYGLQPIRSLGALGILFSIATTLAHYTWEEGSFAPNSGPIIASEAWQEVATATEVENPEAFANPAKYWSGKTKPGQDWESFSRFAYAADLVIPIIDFGQTSAWAPSTERRGWGRHLWYARWWLSAAGW